MTKIYILCCVASFWVSIGAMPIFAWISTRLGAVSEIGGRHVGNRPVGRLGGIAALLGFVTTTMFFYYFYEKVRNVFSGVASQMIGFVLGLIVVSAVGLWDDVRRLPARVKFLGQALSALIAFKFGLRISGVDLPFLAPIELGWLSLPVTFFWIVGVVNAVNLIDGLDGLAGGVLFFAAIVNFIAAIASGSVVPAIFMASMAGALVGFLRYNWHPAAIYLGDGGAYSFGFILAVTGLLAPVQKASTGIAIMVPLLALGVPIFDTSLTMVRRFLNRQGIFSPDRGHLHHVLLDSGISHKNVVVGIYSFCCMFCSIALVTVVRRSQRVGFVLLFVSMVGIVVWSVSVRVQLGRVFRNLVKRKPESYRQGVEKL
jgi:UDP-GlcNAc:undecaprenyl-phosphate GlcNAc-1-phosphate transferase